MMVMLVVAADAKLAAVHCAVLGVFVHVNAGFELVAPLIVPVESEMLMTAEEAASGPPFAALTIQVSVAAAFTGFGAPLTELIERSAAGFTPVVNVELSFALFVS